ncbi:MAG: hypothetical protein LBR54_01800, partial [Oscillospiraceae bacterium]|nr:hypothetical protein [Oscillospiraceae bacterium]
FDARTRLSKEVFGTAQMIAERFDIPLFSTLIRRSIAVSEAQSLQLDVTEYARNTAAIRDFFKLIKELAEQGI